MALIAPFQEGVWARRKLYPDFMKALLPATTTKTLQENSRLRWLALAVLTLFYATSFAQTNTWDGSGGANWNTASSWSLNHVPLAAEDVVIPNGITGTINVNTAAVCSSLTMNGGNTANTLSITGTNSLEVTNAITINAGSGNGDHKILAVNAGTLECGSISLAGTAAANRNTRLTVSTGTITVTGNVSLGDLNSQVTFTGAGSLTVGGDMTGGTFTASTGTVIFDGANQNAGTYTYNNLTLRGTGTKTFATTPTVNGVLSLEGTADVVVTTGVVTYGAGATLRYNKPSPYVATDEEWVSPFNGSGGVVINSSTVTMNDNKVLGNNAPLTINPGATLSTSGSNFSLTLQGNFVNSGTFSAGGSDIIIAGTATQNIAGFTTTGNVSMTKTAATATLTGNVNAPTLTINGTGGTLNLGVGLTHVISGDWTRNAGTVDGGSSTLQIGGNTIDVGGTFTAGTGTVEYTAPGAQTVAGVNYNNLILSGSGLKTLQPGTTAITGGFTLAGTVQASAAASLTVGGTVALGAGTTFNAGTFTHNVAGNWTNNGSTFNNDGGTVNLNGTAQAINGANTFYNLTLSGSNTKTFNAPVAVENTLTINTGVIANLSTFLTHSANMLYFGSAGQNAGTWGGTTSAAANINSTFFSAATGILTVAVKGATTYYSRQSGSWNASATWSTITYSNATNNGTFPIAGDIVNIGGGNYTITVNTNSQCAALNFLGSDNDSPTVTISNGITLDVSGQINIAATDFGDANTLAVGAGNLNAGSLTFGAGGFFGGQVLSISSGTATIAGAVTHGGGLSLATITFTGAGVANFGGAFDLSSLNCTFTASTGTVEYNGAVAQTMGDFTYNNLIISGIGIKTVAGPMNIDGNFTLSAGTTFTPGGNTHTLQGNWINNGATFDNASSSITFDGTAQSIGGASATAFNNLTLAGSGTKSFAQPITVDGLMSINSGVVANLGSITTHTARALSLNNAGQTPGTYGSTSSAATNQNNTFFTAGQTGILTVVARAYFSRQSGNWSVNATWSTVTYGNATNTGTFPGAGDVAYVGGGNYNINVTANAACTSLNFQANASNSPTVSINSGITLNVSGAVTIPATSFFSGDVNTLAVGAGILNAGSLAFASGGLLGEKALTISSGTATINGDVTNAGLSFAEITFTGAGQLILRGDFLNSGNCDFAAGTGTVNYNASGKAQEIGDFTYYNLTLNNTFGTSPQLSLIDNTTATNSLTMTSGIVNMDGNTFTLGASGGASTLTRTASTTTNWMYGGTFRRFWLNATPVTSTNYGLFPVGHSTPSSYRPVTITSTSNPNTGSFSVTHTNAASVTDLSPTYNDAGTAITRKHNAQFVTSTTVGAGTYNISVTMTDLFASGNLSDIRLAASNGATTVTNFGTHQAATGSVSNPTATRTGVAIADLDQDWRITTTNLNATPLPVELSYFNAVLMAEQVNLDWETKTEHNNALFVVEKTRDFESFYTVGQIEGHGTSRTATKYSLVDAFPLSGRSYYRLKQIDFDGTSTYSKPVMVVWDGTETPSMTVFPNPAKGVAVKIIVSNVAEVGVLPLKVFDLRGRLVFESTLAKGDDGVLATEIPLNINLAKGIYIIKAGRTLALTRKLFIE